MSLCYVQKLIYTLNRDPNVVAQFQTDMDGVLKEYTLTDEEKHAIRKPDIGLLYVMGVNGQLLMHYAALMDYEWNAVETQMECGWKIHGICINGK